MAPKDDGIIIGPNHHIEQTCLVGYVPQRPVPDLTLRLGANCFLRTGTIIYCGTTIGDNLQTGHNVIIREENTIGNDVSIGTGSIVEHHVIIEDGVRIHSQAFIPEFSKLEQGCWLGPNVVLTNALHPQCPQVKNCLKGATIGRRAKIGANTTILPDRKVGEDALVGAGSVVVKDVPPRTVVAGNPARVIKQIDELDCPYDLVERPYL